MTNYPIPTKAVKDAYGRIYRVPEAQLADTGKVQLRLMRRDGWPIWTRLENGQRMTINVSGSTTIHRDNIAAVL